MPTRISPSVYGARAAKEMLYRIRRVNAAKGETDIERVFILLEQSLEDPRTRRGVLLVLAEYLSVSLEGSCIHLEDWTPLEIFDPESPPSTARVRRG